MPETHGPRTMDTQQTKDNISANSPGDILETLAEALTHAEPSVRESAAREFAKRKEKRGISLLVEVLSDENSVVRMAAATALNELGWRPADDTLHARHAAALQEFQVVSTLGAAAIDPLLILLEDKDASLRMAALETLGQIGGSRALKLFIEVLNDENPHVRAVAVQTLSKLNDPQAIEPLSKLSRDQSWEVRSATVDALQNIQSSQSIPALLPFARDDAADVRLRAVELLGNSGDARAITVLVAARVDENIAVREAADISLRKINTNWADTEEAKTAKPSLLAALKHEDDRIRTVAADILRAIGQTPAMNSYLTAESGSAPQTAVTVLAQTLRSANPELRQAAAEALGRTGDAGAVPFLVEALRDEDQFVREAALYSLNVLNWKPANDTDVVLRAVILQRWETALLFDSLALEPLVMSLESDESAVCKAAIETIGKIGNKRAIEPLAVMLTHPSKVVRVAAAQALRQLGWQPSDPKQSVLLAIELGDWQAVICQGESAVEPLIVQIKENQADREFCESAASALGSLIAPRAATPLLGYTRDGQVAESAIRGLINLVENVGGEMAVEDLQAIASLSNVFQYRYTFDARYGIYVRSGLQEVDNVHVKKLARQELARRGIDI